MTHEFKFKFTNRDQRYCQALECRVDKGNWTIRGKVLKAILNVLNKQLDILNTPYVEKTVVN